MDARAQEARKDISALLEELQRALSLYKKGSIDPDSSEQLRYIQELTNEIVEIERNLALGMPHPEVPIEKSAQPNGLAIVVGHTGSAPGLAGIVPPFRIGDSEYPWNTDLADKMKVIAVQRGYRCDVFFRDRGGITGAYERVREWNPQATVELHFNADLGRARGTETLYKNGNTISKGWAKVLQDGMVEFYNRAGTQNRGIKARSPGERGYDSVSRLHPSALVEPFFGDNTADAQLGVDLKEREAQVLVDAFATYVDQQRLASNTWWRRLFSVFRTKADPDIPAQISAPPNVCAVPEDYLLNEEENLRMRAAAQPAIDTLLGTSAGLYGYGANSRRYGIRQTVEALQEVGRVWALRGNVPRIGIGDISLRGGGDISGHASHEKGIDVDIRPLTNNGAESPTTYQNSNYSRELTQELCDLIHANGKLAVQFIFFNDPNVESVRPYQGHDNHLHVRNWLPGMTTALPLLGVGSEGPIVRELQRRLNFWIAGEPSAGSQLVIDGDFGNGTRDAVLAFQRLSGVPETGRVEEDTWRALPTHQRVEALT